jgi:hypothetical protein
LDHVRHVSWLIRQIRLVRLQHVAIRQREFHSGYHISSTSPLAQQRTIAVITLNEPGRENNQWKHSGRRRAGGLGDRKANADMKDAGADGTGVLGKCVPGLGNAIITRLPGR